jgi:putative glutamine amidotransferase
MTPPLIGIVGERWSSSITTPNRRVIGQLGTYVEAVRGAGGLPVIVPPLPEADLPALYARLDGLLLAGGADLDPALYRAAPHPATTGLDPERDAAELLLARRALAERKPLLGICRGAQALAVAAGGTLYQDLPTEVAGALPHAFPYPDYAADHLAHPVRVEEDSLLARCLGTPVAQVNSRHHQAARQVPVGLQVVAWAPDGVIEALEAPGHPCALGVQWHPENLQARPEMKALFVHFVRAAAAEGSQRSDVRG